MSKFLYSDYLEKVLASTGGNVYWLDQNCVYQGCNHNVAKTLRLRSREEIVGLTDDDLLRYGNWNMEQAESFARDDREVIQTKKPKCNVEEPVIYDENGNAVYFLTTRIPIFDDKGDVIGIVGTSTDITALKKAEQSLLIAKQQAEAAHQAKTEFLASMSHDVKTPLGGVIATSELLASRANNAEDKKMLEDIERCGKRLLSFFENCIELSKMDMAELQVIEKVFSMKKITDAIHDLFVPRATAKKLLFSVHLDSSLPDALVGNQNNIYRVILNLIGNAMKFTEKGAVDLSMKLHERMDDENVIIKIIVKDTGIGIPKDKQKIIFEKLQRLTPSYYNKQEGHGIGLYIVDQYVNAMHGHIDVESDVGKGSVFTVTLPLKVAKDAKNAKNDLVDPPKLTPKEVPSAAIVRPYVPPTLKNTKDFPDNAPRVLLVEDNAMIQAVTRQIIHAAEAVVDVASSGKEALELFVPGKYDVIYMDLGLPDVYGYEVSQRIRAIEKEQHATPTPILALSAHISEDLRGFCEDAGMQGMLNKPLSLLQARQVLEYFVEKKSTIIEGLKWISKPVNPEELSASIIDFAGCVALMGDETRAKEMLAMLMQMLDDTFLLEISQAYISGDDVELRKAIHKFLGSVCYISAPALKQATLDFQTAVKEQLPTRSQVYQTFLNEIEKFKADYLTLEKNNFESSTTK